MCVIYIAFGQHPDHPLILLANRDEYYARPSLAAAFWDDFPEIYAGRDLVGGGTWLGVNKRGRIAAVTNYRDPSAPTGIISRGQLVADYLQSSENPGEYLEKVMRSGRGYSGFNLIVGEISSRCEQLFYCSNRGEGIIELSKGIYGLSNHLLDTPWPKVRKGKNRLASLLNVGNAIDDRYFEVLADETLAEDDELPSTGIPHEAEKAISAVFI
ncbi:MAG: NRDE family protein, partial [Pyrinomonadaceae bacterium]